MKIGLALGGGGARGLAHIGVLEALEENNIKPHFVAGTSIGAVIGAIYCQRDSAKNLHAQAKALVRSPDFKNFNLDEFYTEDENVFERFKKEVFEKFYWGQLFFKKSHIKTEATRKLFEGLFGAKTFDDFKIPFICNGLDIQSGEEILFTSGSIADAVWASCAIPGILAPFTKAEKILVDGSVVDTIPIEPTRKIGAKIVLAIYLGERPEFHGAPETGFKMYQRSFAFMKYHYDQRILAQADLVIKPEVGKFHWADFSALDELVEKGRAAVTKNIKAIKSLTSFWYRLKKII